MLRARTKHQTAKMERARQVVGNLTGSNQSNGMPWSCSSVGTCYECRGDGIWSHRGSCASFCLSQRCTGEMTVVMLQIAHQSETMGEEVSCPCLALGRSQVSGCKLSLSRGQQR